ncbi:MAG: cell division protein FtsZ [Armatimonadetes bacterium]|nr:cell division protein FtsZ [Armatimonadota bacterium]
MSPKNLFEFQAVLKVVGVGGGGCNAVNRMVSSGVQGVEFIALNTDSQALEECLAPTRVMIGESATRGLGTGGDPEKGYQAAKESEKIICELLEGADMVFVTAGMGGGTGTGAAPFVAELAKRMDAVTVGVVTRPFGFEGPRRKKNAQSGLDSLAARTDTVIVIPNDNLIQVVERKTSLGDAFVIADDVLRMGVQGVSDIVTRPGLVNLDFADVKSVLKDAGIALMGMGRGVGEQRARVAAEAAASSPLLETRIHGATRLLVNITSGPDFSIGEAYDAMEYLLQMTDAEDASVFMGQVIDEALGDDVLVTVLAAGMESTAPVRLDAEVFAEPVVRPAREVQPAQPPAGTRGAPKEIEIDEIDLDIPAFLRKRQQRI